MRRTMLILALAFGMGFLATNKVNAIHPMQFNTLITNFNAEFNLERDIRLENWMLSVPSFMGKTATEGEVAVSPWMFDTSWTCNPDELADEPELRLENWMIAAPEANGRTIALEEWMLHITI
jgi:hypothetical protein